MALDVIRLLPDFHERVWGVNRLEPWFSGYPMGRRLGEAWFTSNANRTAGGRCLGELLAEDGEAILGRPGAFCPLLLKFIFTSDRLSVQVHPDDDYAARHHQCLGKTEAWYVLHAEPEARVGLGLKRPLSPERARDAVHSGEIEELLDWRPAAAGDVFLVPAGTIHAIGAGLTLVEIQENSDITYRLYDYGRPRELHLEHGLAVSALEPYTTANTHLPLQPGRELLASCAHFQLERWKLEGTLHFDRAAHYHLLVILRGSGTISGQPFGPGQVWLAPARSRAFTIETGDAELLLGYASAQPTESFYR